MLDVRATIDEALQRPQTLRRGSVVVLALVPVVRGGRVVSHRRVAVDVPIQWVGGVPDVEATAAEYYRLRPSQLPYAPAEVPS